MVVDPLETLILGGGGLVTRNVEGVQEDLPHYTAPKRIFYEDPLEKLV